MMFEKYDAYKDSGVEWIGDIPIHWDVKNLRYAFDFLNHRRIPLSALERGNKQGRYPYYGASGIIDYVDAYLFDEKLLLIAEDGANLLSKSTPLAFLAEGKYWVNNHAHILKPKTEAYGFWEKLLCSVDYTVFITGAAQPKLSRENLGGIRLPIPPINEQLKIAKFLEQKTSEIDQAIAIKEQQIALLNERKQIVIQKAVTQGLDPNVPMKDSGVEWIGQIPEHWNVIRAKYLFKEVEERSVLGNEELLSVSHLTGVTPRSEKNVSMFMAEDYSGSKVCKRHDLVMNIMWAWMGALGVSDYDGIVSPAYGVYRQKIANTFNSEYLEYLLKTTKYIEHYNRVSTGLHSSRLRFYGHMFFNMKLGFPCLDEQSEIIVRIKNQTSKIELAVENLANQIEKLKEYKTTLINDAVTGKIKVA
ncbi:MAG: restriction endonuclease subunit S [Paludibacteraceae bacterium]|nr:restriction endonuclease subunit S [Paludibacteraceae bacterium]